jgi:hypothetical protein
MEREDRWDEFFGALCIHGGEGNEEEEEDDDDMTTPRLDSNCSDDDDDNSTGMTETMVPSSQFQHSKKTGSYGWIQAPFFAVLVQGRF